MATDPMVNQPYKSYKTTATGDMILAGDEKISDPECKAINTDEVWKDNGLPFYLKHNDSDGTWSIYLRGEHFPSLIDGFIEPFDVACDMVNRYNRSIVWFLRDREKEKRTAQDYGDTK